MHRRVVLRLWVVGIRCHSEEVMVGLGRGTTRPGLVGSALFYASAWFGRILLEAEAFSWRTVVSLCFTDTSLESAPPDLFIRAAESLFGCFERRGSKRWLFSVTCLF